MHWVSISSEHDLTPESAQYVWLLDALTAAVANRAVVPWIVLSIHKPVYCSEDGGPRFQAELEPLLLQFDVDITFTGHMHCYERVHPSEDSKVTVYPVKELVDGEEVDVYYSTGKGPVHVVQGNTGAMQFETFLQPQPEWSAFRMANGYVTKNRTHTRNADADATVEGLILESNYTDTFGFGYTTFVNATHMYYQNIPVSGTIGLEKFWVVKRV